MQHAETICTQVDRLLASHAIWVSEHSCLTEALLTAAARGTQGPLQSQVRPAKLFNAWDLAAAACAVVAACELLAADANSALR